MGDSKGTTTPRPVAAKIMGAQIRALRNRLGWSQERLAAEADLSTGLISKVENGSAARLDSYEAIARALKVEVTDLINGSELPASDAKPPPASSSYRDTRLNLITQNLDNLRRLDDLNGARGLLELVENQAALLRHVIDTESTEDTRIDALGLLARHRQFMGWISLDLGNTAEALRYYGLAFDSAMKADNQQLARYLAGWRSFTALGSGDLNEARQWIGLSHAIGPEEPSFALEAWLAALHAQIHAAGGEAADSQALLEKASALLDKDRGRDSSDLYHFSHAALAGYRGVAALYLRDPGSSIEDLTLSINQLPDGFHRAKGVYLAHLMHASLLEGDTDSAISHGLEAIRISTSTHSVRCLSLINRLLDTYSEQLQTHVRYFELKSRAGIAGMQRLFEESK